METTKVHAVLEVPVLPTVRRVLPFGTKVILTHVDRYGYCGRDHHPREEDVGFVGTVVANVVEQDGDCMENVMPFTVLKNGTHEDEYQTHETAMYTVIHPLGRQLEVMEHELEVLVGW